MRAALSQALEAQRDNLLESNVLVSQVGTLVLGIEDPWLLL